MSNSHDTSSNEPEGTEPAQEGGNRADRRTFLKVGVMTGGGLAASSSETTIGAPVSNRNLLGSPPISTFRMISFKVRVNGTFSVYSASGASPVKKRFLVEVQPAVVRAAMRMKTMKLCMGWGLRYRYSLWQIDKLPSKLGSNSL